MPAERPLSDRELPLAGSPERWGRQRSAASHNHTAILRAANELFARDGVEAVDVRQIAAAAGVGVGTVYRRFGDKASVIAELVGDQERELQDALLSGPPPLGPGAPPRQRLEAFLRRLGDLTERNLDLLLACEHLAPGARYRTGGYGSWHQHLTILLERIAPDLDAGWYADVLLAPLGPGLYALHRRQYGVAPDVLADRVVEAARRIIG